MNCEHCDEPILENERDPRFDMHAECIFRMVAGSAGHQLRECPCFGGTRMDPPGMSRRDAAKLALDTYRVLHGEVVTLP